MNLLNQSAFLKALGWSLLDSLWQMGLLWLVYIAITANGKKFQSRQRHTIALLSLAGGILWFLINLVVTVYKAAMEPEVITITDLSTVEPSLFGWLEPALPFLSLAWLAAIAFLFVRFYHQYRQTQRLFTNGLQKVDWEWRVFVQELSGRMGIKKKVQIWLSNLVDTPVTIGFLKPVILLPVAAVNQLSMSQAEAIIVHELNHIRSNDYLVNLLIACVDVLFFFNPFSGLLIGIIRREREHCCDDLVLQFRYDAQSYARALLTLEQNRVATSPLTVAATGKDKQVLLNRVKRILGREPVSTPINHKLIAYLLTATLIAFIGWYNPGKVIVKKIDTIRNEVAANDVFAVRFTTPMQGEEASFTIETPAKASPRPRPDRTKRADTTSQRAEIKKLEQIIEVTTDARLAALDEQLENITEHTVIFTAEEDDVDYSLPQMQTGHGAAPLTASPTPALLPYVPGNSFFYQALEDTSLPKKYIMTVGDQKAKEAMENALKALKQVDWKKMESALAASGEKVDVVQLQKELTKALHNVDWAKINTETQAATDGMKARQEAYVIKLGNYQRERVMLMEKQKNAQQQILLDRLEQHERLKKLDEDKRKTTQTKRKKIVQI